MTLKSIFFFSKLYYQINYIKNLDQIVLVCILFDQLCTKRQIGRQEGSQPRAGPHNTGAAIAIGSQIFEF